MFTVLVQTLGAIALSSPPAADPGWLATTRLSVVLVDAVLEDGDRKQEEPATGFVVGWGDPILYVLTAGHAVEDREKGLIATKLTVRFGAEFCPDSIEAKPAYRNREHDFAVLAVPLPGRCAANLSRLRRLRISPLASTTTASLLQQERVSILGRSAEGSVAPVREILLRGTTPEHDILLDTSKVVRQLSGAPVLSDQGELIGMITGGSPSEGLAASYAVIRAELANAKIPRDFAGEVASLLLKGAPPGSTLAVDGATPEPVRDINELAPGKRRNIVVANVGDYEPATAVVDLLSEATVRRCVTLTRPGDRRFARWRWPVFWTSLAVGAAGAVTGVVSWQTHRSFDSMPTRSSYDSVRVENIVADSLMGAGLLGLTAFGLGHARWTPRERSEIGECTQ